MYYIPGTFFLASFLWRPCFDLAGTEDARRGEGNREGLPERSVLRTGACVCGAYGARPNVAASSGGGGGGCDGGVGGGGGDGAAASAVAVFGFCFVLFCFVLFILRRMGEKKA